MKRDGSFVSTTATLGKREQHTIDYRSRFTNWGNRASVRTKPLRILEEHFDGKLFFPPELVAGLDHPDMKSVLTPQLEQRILMHRLHAYLTFTTDLEQLVVNPVTQLLSREQLGFTVPKSMLRDAYKICTDESWHALFSDDLAEQIIEATGEQPVPLPRPRFLADLDRLTAAEDSSIRGLTTLFFTVVSETLISAILCGIPKDRRIVTAVRDTIADHAEDEGRHHAFYATFFEYAWHQLGPAQRAAIGPLLPEFMVAFLGPDTAALEAVLAVAPLDAETVRGVVEESTPAPAVQASIRKAGAATIRLFTNQGVLEDCRTFDRFAEMGLIDG
jgi:P-aminobenzoate N-oxygenase AurF